MLLIITAGQGCEFSYCSECMAAVAVRMQPPHPLLLLLPTQPWTPVDFAVPTSVSRMSLHMLQMSVMGGGAFMHIGHTVCLVSYITV